MRPGATFSNVLAAFAAKRVLENATVLNGLSLKERKQQMAKQLACRQILWRLVVSIYWSSPYKSTFAYGRDTQAGTNGDFVPRPAVITRQSWYDLGTVSRMDARLCKIVLSEEFATGAARLLYGGFQFISSATYQSRKWSMPILRMRLKRGSLT